MENILKIGKFALMGLVLLVTVLAASEAVDLMVLIKFSLFLFYLAVAATVGFAIFNVIENPKAGMKFIIGIVFLAVVLGIGYAASDVAVDSETGEDIWGSQLTEGGIYTLYTVTFLAVALIGFSEVKRILKF